MRAVEEAMSFRELLDNTDAIEELRLRIIEDVERHIHSRLRSIANSEDLAQEVLIRLWSSAENGEFSREIFVNGEEFTRIAARVCQLVCIEWVRRMYRMKRGGQLLKADPADAVAMLIQLAEEKVRKNLTPHQAVAEDELAQIVRSKINLLSTTSREIYHLRYECNRTFVEIGESLGKAADNVRMKHNRHNARIRSEFVDAGLEND